MIKKLRFYQTLENQWFIDLPEYLIHGEGPNGIEPNEADLQMVLGADKFLDELSEEGNEVYLLISTDVKEIRDYEELPMFAKHGWDWISRANYVETFNGCYYTNGARYLWLCPVTEFIFGEYPKNIYYKKVSYDTKTEKVQIQEDGPDF